MDKQTYLVNPMHSSMMRPRFSLAAEYSRELGWGNAKTPLSERSLADQAAHKYCTLRRNEAIAPSAASDI